MFMDEDMHCHAAENLAQADVLLFGRVTYELMEAGWRPFARTGAGKPLAGTGAGKPRERTVQTYALWLANHEQSHIRQIERIVNMLRTWCRVTARRRKEATNPDKRPSPAHRARP